jgi:LmbE family N-acetylglucosaminyl deacetylase
MQRKDQFMKRVVTATVAAIILTVYVPFASVRTADAQVRPIYDRGASGLGQMLKRLQTTASALHTAAHPDDEDSGLLAYLARKEQARTAYLSLNRGDGGQNVIGQELFEGLGVIRTEELLQARRLDGGDQFFTRTMDYGFSKTRAEAARIWGEREVLGDMVRTIRMYRPLVIISRFSGTPADGHGQHQLAGYLTPIAFKAAADPNEFPEQIREGLEPWQALKLYVSQGFAADPNNPPSLVLNTGEYDPLIGRSYFEIAMEGRSQHKSQEMGVLELRGTQNSGMNLVESKLAAKSEKETSVFDGIDTSITGILKLANDDYTPALPKLQALQDTAAEALRSYDPYNPQKLIPILARGVQQAEEAEMATRNTRSKALIREKRREFETALQMSAGVVVDALSSTETIVPGDAADVSVRVFAPESSAVKVTGTQLSVPQGWTAASQAEPVQPPTNSFRPRREPSTAAAFFKVAAPADAQPSQPYWLVSSRKDFNFDWSAAGDSRNMPFSAPLLTANVKMNIGGREITVSQPVQYRYADDIRGEIRRDIAVVPALTVGLESDLLIAPITGQDQKRRLVMTVENHSPRPAKGSAKFALPTGWTLSPASAPFDLGPNGSKTALSFDVSIPAAAKADSYKLTAIAESDGKTYSSKVQEIAYPHIQTHRIFTKGDITAHVIDLKVAPVKIGYIMGSGDKIPEAIRRLGLDVTMLGEKELSTGDLSQFDTIIVGIRASQTRPDFVANNGRLLDFARNGGTLIVQYQQHEYVQNNLQPFPASMTGVTRGNQRISNLRVTDENAKVTILVPDHPIFNYPNKITDADWANWVQERNLYSFSTFDPQYTALAESNDEGEDPVRGGMVYAKLGKGQYLYTSYSWFRQLPAGTPGAYRIFANILSLAKAPKQ